MLGDAIFVVGLKQAADDICIISIGQDSCIRNTLWQKVLDPECPLIAFIGHDFAVLLL